MRVSLRFAQGQSSIDRSRLEYAFRLFCAIYGNEPVIGREGKDVADIEVTYVDNGSAPASLRLHNAYVMRPLNRPAPPPSPFVRDGESTVLFYPVPPTCEPDWLGEIFEWVSCADEYSICERDSVGRIPFARSYAARHNLNPRRPYASIAMQFLQRALGRMYSCGVAHPQCPVQDAKHLVVNTHDVDFLPLRRLDSVSRLAKNGLISLIVGKSPTLAAAQALQAIRVAFGGKDRFGLLTDLADKERVRSVTSSYYFLCRHAHRRDGNYDIGDPAILRLIQSLQPDMEVGVHGSYCSLEHEDGLAEEFGRLRELGVQPVGVRLHWLRFTLDLLIDAVERAGAAYDASLGWPDTIGFRAATCSAFPPYDFQREGPASFLEIPLVIMDREAEPHNGNQNEAACEALAASRRYGWGGISVLWHPTAFGGGQLPVQVGDAFWTLLDNGVQHKDTWLSAASFVKDVWRRYSTAELLPPRVV